MNLFKRKQPIILIGEIRDKETISEDVVASMIGYLLYSDIESNDLYAIRRMVNMFNKDK